MFKMLDDKPTVNQFGEIEGAYQFGRSDVKTTEQLKVGDVLSGHGYPKITKKEHIRTTKGGKKIYKLGYQHTRKEQGYNEGHSFDRESNEGQGHFLLNSSQHSVHQFGEDHGALESHGYKLRKNSQTRFSHDKLNAHVDFAKDGSWHHYSENAGTKYTNKKGKGTQELNNHLTEHHKIGSQHSEQFKESISDILQSFGYKRGDTGGWANGEHSVHTIAGGQGAFKHTHKGKSTTGVDKEDLISHLRKVHSSQHSELSQPLTFAPTARGIIGPPVQFREEEAEQFGEEHIKKVLAKHGYEEYGGGNEHGVTGGGGHGGVGFTSYSHKNGHEVTHWDDNKWEHHSPATNKLANDHFNHPTKEISRKAMQHYALARGNGHKSLDAQLTKLHGSQHSEEHKAIFVPTKPEHHAILTELSNLHSNDQKGHYGYNNMEVSFKKHELLKKLGGLHKSGLNNLHLDKHGTVYHSRIKE